MPLVSLTVQTALFESTASEVLTGQEYGPSTGTVSGSTLTSDNPLGGGLRAGYFITISSGPNAGSYVMTGGSGSFELFIDGTFPSAGAVTFTVNNFELGDD